MNLKKLTKDIFNAFTGSNSDSNSGDTSVEIICSPMKGRVLPLTEVPDTIFASKMLGDGVAIEPEEGLITSPVSGEIVVLFDTLHAIALKTKSGVELLIHIGIDTVELGGRGFTPFVEQGDFVKTGDKLLEIDLQFIKNNGKPVITPLVVTNLSEFPSIDILENTNVSHGDELFRINLK